MSLFIVSYFWKDLFGMGAVSGMDLFLPGSSLKFSVTITLAHWTSLQLNFLAYDKPLVDGLGHLPGQLTIPDRVNLRNFQFPFQLVP